MIAAVIFALLAFVVQPNAETWFFAQREDDLRPAAALNKTGGLR